MIITTPHVDSSAGELFRLDLAMPQAPHGQGLRFEAGGPTYFEGKMEIGGRQEWGDLKFRTMADRTTVYRHFRHLKRSWPPVLQSGAVSILVLAIVNWAMATMLYYLVFAEDRKAERRQKAAR